MGIPLIAHTIKAALAAKSVTKLVVSTDSHEIAAIANQYANLAEHLRPPELATDNALTIDVLIYEISRLKEHGCEYEYTMLLQPTSPLRTPEDIDSCVTSLAQSDSDTLISVCDVDGYHPLRMKSICNGRLTNYIETGVEDMRPRHLLPRVYIRNGAIYLKHTAKLLSHRSFASDNTIPYVMDAESSINIDSKIDFFLAEALLSSRAI